MYPCVSAYIKWRKFYITLFSSTIFHPILFFASVFVFFSLSLSLFYFIVSLLLHLRCWSSNFSFLFLRNMCVCAFQFDTLIARSVSVGEHMRHSNVNSIQRCTTSLYTGHPHIDTFTYFCVYTLSRIYIQGKYYRSGNDKRQMLPLPLLFNLTSIYLQHEQKQQQEHHHHHQEPSNQRRRQKNARSPNHFLNYCNVYVSCLAVAWLLPFNLVKQPIFEQLTWNFTFSVHSK